MIELAASAMVVTLLTGIALWRPSASQSGLPQAGVCGRTAWKQWHAFLGVVLGILTFTILATGLTWSKCAGEQIRTARNALGQAPTPMPSHLESAIPHAQASLTWQSA